MGIIFSIIKESIAQAVQQLLANKLRSFLSLLGILIGILCIILILSAVDSLEANIEGSFDKLGRDVLYVDKWPWNENPDENYWKYAKRPAPDYKDFDAIKRKVGGSDLASLSVFLPTNTIKYRNNSIKGAYMTGVTFDFGEIFNLDLAEGRYFTRFEHATGLDKCIIGYELADRLFKGASAVGKTLTIRGRKIQIIGVVQKEGNSIIDIIPFDRAVIVSYFLAKKMVNVNAENTWGTMLNLRAAEGIHIDDVREELTGVLRVERRLKPKEKDNFSINEASTLTNLLKPIFKTMNTVGAFIGIFAILVGMFSVANIMFVSVKERTNQIGVKKALGAKKSIILFEFLIESVILCLLGGIVAILIVFLIAQGASALAGFNFILPLRNIVLGMTMSIIIGVLAGIIPAWQAAKMDPVEAIRA